MSNEQVLSLTKRYVPAAFGVLMLAAALVSRFAVLSNDSFPLLWQARHLSLSDPASFYNGFFPIGYPLLMRFAEITQDPLTTLEIVQVVLAPIYLIVAMRFFARFLRPEVIFLGIVALVAYPDFLRCVLSATPDFLASLAALTAFYLIAKEHYGYAGVAFGCGLLFRAHILGLFVTMVIATLLLHKNGKFEIAGRMVLGAIPFILLQGMIQVWSGHSFFESAQAFNVYRTMYGINWNTPPRFPISTLDIIAHDPFRFAAAYFVNLANGAIVLLPIAILLILNRKHRQGLALVTICFGVLLYVLVITAAFSPRALLPVWPSSVLAGMAILQSIEALFKPRMLMLAGLVASAVIIVGVIVASYGSRERVNEYEKIGQVLHLNAAKDLHAIYTDDFAFYVPQFHDATARTTGTWGVVGLPEYSKDALELDWRSAESLRSSMRNAGIQTAIIRVPPLNSNVAALISSDTAHFPLILKTRTHNTYRVK